jgi:hypothetical protein
MPRGGSRKGAGRPKIAKSFSDEVKKDFLKAAKEKARETGQTLGQVVVGLIYDGNIQDSVRIAALKAWAEVVVVKERKSTIETKERLTPTIYLPEIAPKPKELEKVFANAKEIKH